MSRLIDADALKEAINSRTRWCNLLLESNEVLDIIDKQPDVEPVRHGKWIDENCSICGQYVYHGDARNFCPSCGARMEVSE